MINLLKVDIETLIQRQPTEALNIGLSYRSFDPTPSTRKYHDDLRGLMSYGFVYITTNLINGMKYIGQTHYAANMPSTYCGSGKAIMHAVRKYGRAAFVREIIFEAFSREDLDWAECHFISKYDAVKSRKFYNISPGGRASLGFTGKKHTEERNRKLSEKMKASHPRAIQITIDGQTYNGLGVAARATGHSSGKLLKYLETGIHPRDQVHGGTGVHKRSPTTKKWKLLKFDGEIVVVEGLKPWCRENQINHHLLVKSAERKTFVCGYQLIGDHVD